jgi:uncharacterized protein
MNKEKEPDKRRDIWRSLLLSLGLFFITACSTTSAPSPSPLPTPATSQRSIPTPSATASPVPTPTASPTQTLQPSPTFHPLMIAGLRQRSYPGSPIAFVQQLDPGANYTRQVISYQSDGLKIYALLTIPNGTPPANGWPAIVFNHGYIPPKEYRTTERYVAYVDAIAKRGYVVIKPDYRGHGSSEGQATGGYSTPDYTVDVLNALTSIRAYPGVDAQKVGMWGHSMGGMITLRSMVVSQDVKVGVIWGGVVGSYADLLTRWRATPPASLSPGATSWRRSFFDQFGAPEQNPDFWASISPDSFLQDLSGPLQLHHATTDEEVPVFFSQDLYAKAQAAGDTVELYLYPGDNHNITNNFSLAMQRSIAFFDLYLKN